jgi:hypothetical protein
VGRVLFELTGYGIHRTSELLRDFLNGWFFHKHGVNIEKLAGFVDYKKGRFFQWLILLTFKIPEGRGVGESECAGSDCPNMDISNYKSSAVLSEAISSGQQSPGGAAECFSLEAVS